MYNKYMKNLTLCFLVRDDEVCLAMKKRGFGEGKWNGYGGKLEEGETATQAAVREIQEESEVIVREEDLQPAGVIDFYFKDNPEWNQKVHIFTVFTWDRDPIETEEMRPQWFPHSSLSTINMWDGDILWLPQVLRGESVSGSCNFSGNPPKVESTDFKFS